ncbi:unannotated protein [freshwater metagenome]|uniref:Unannotated protein n=1 Tax=freshwater metagenome TaxID=449393 RepID=A0A6J6B1R8_9ZZZZ|nr:hypothetical protein [Actinomycetota bacterium]
MATVSSANAAPKSVTAKPLAPLMQDLKVEGLTVSKKAILTYENLFSLTADIKVRAFDFAGSEIWSKTIDSGLDEVATASAVDAEGNIWLAGNSAMAALPESATADMGALNPDGVEVENPKPVRADMKNLTIWQINTNGELVSQSSIPNVALVDAISVSTSGISIIASNEAGQFLTTFTAGKFSSDLKIGTTKTKLSSIARSPDGTTYLFGATSENLGGTKLVGRVDGVLIKVAKTGVITSVVRSTAPKAIRNWQSATTSLFVTGSVRIGKTVESALTKFNSSFKPIWTTRIASTGSTLAANGPSGSVYAILEPTSALKGITGLKLAKGQSVVLQFDSKGLLISAFTSAELIAPVIATYSSATGLVILTSGGKVLKVPTL